MDSRGQMETRSPPEEACRYPPPLWVEKSAVHSSVGRTLVLESLQSRVKSKYSQTHCIIYPFWLYENMPNISRMESVRIIRVYRLLDKYYSLGYPLLALPWIEGCYCRPRPLNLHAHCPDCYWHGHWVLHWMEGRGRGKEGVLLVEL